jgi:hypothetical protein|nr:MAG TPA: hypothetical protein [Caudoviricetes sp.]
MKKYEVIGKSACLGAGMILHLTEQQAAVRRDCLTQKNGNYIVNIPVYFKKGEIIGIVTGDVSKSLMPLLKETSRTDSPNKNSSKNNANDENEENLEKNNDSSSDFPKMKHVGFGNYDIFNKDGEKITDKPVTKQEAETLLKNLSNNEE